MMPALRHLFTASMVVAALAHPCMAAAEDDRLGGHFGTVLPIVSHAGGQTTTIGDAFKIGFPMGITVKKTDVWAFDLEVVPVIARDRFVSITLHPGVIHSLPNRLAAGVRMAFDAREASWGFSPLINRAVGRGPLFVEAVVPIRFQQTASGANQTSIGLAAHIGVGF